MMLNKKVGTLFIVLLLSQLIGCTKIKLYSNQDAAKTQSLGLAELAEYITKKNLADRSLAQEEVVTCAVDRKPEDLLKDLLKEGQFSLPSKNNGRMSFAGIDLNKFSNEDRIYLMGVGEELLIEKVDISKCTSVNCIYEALYPNRGEKFASLDKYWYFKFGHIISNNYKNIGLDFSQTPLTYSDFTFKENEREAIKRLSFLLSERFEFIKSIKSIHRYADNYYLPGEVFNHTDKRLKEFNEKQAKGETKYCGAANFSHKKLFLSEKCLELKDTRNHHQPFFHNFTHEYAHFYDYDTEKAQFMSLSDGWKSLSGWRNVVSMEPDNKSEEKWIFDQNAAFVTAYSKESPIEDFAEALTFYRLNPSKLKEISESKYQYIKDMIYSGKEFTESGLIDYFTNQISTNVLSVSTQYFQRCLTEQGAQSLEGEIYFQDDLGGVVSQDTIVCLNQKIRTAITSQMNYFKKNDIDGCRIFASFKDRIINNVFQKIKTKLIKNINENGMLTENIQKSEELKKELTENVNAVAAVINCSHEESGEACYKKSMSASFDIISEKYATKLEKVLPALREMFLNSNDYLKVKMNIYNSFDYLLFGLKSSLNLLASERFLGCYEKHKNQLQDASSVDSYYPYQGNFYIHADILNCINRDFHDDFKKIIKSKLAVIKLDVTDDILYVFLSKIYSPVYAEKVEVLAKKLKEEEEVLVQREKTSMQSEINNQMVLDLSWIGEGDYLDQKFRETCVNTATKNIETMANIKKDEFNKKYIFHRVEVLTKEMKEIVCENILKQDVTRNKIEALKFAKANSLLSTLERKMQFRLAQKRIKCAEEFSSGLKKMLFREQCLTNFISWKNMEDEVLEEFYTNEAKGLETQKVTFVEFMKNKKETWKKSVLVEMKKMK